MSISGDKPRYGAGIAHYILPYTTTKTVFFAVGFLMGIAPIALDILGVESFTIGPASSIFTIFLGSRIYNR